MLITSSTGKNDLLFWNAFSLNSNIDGDSGSEGAGYDAVIFGHLKEPPNLHPSFSIRKASHMDMHVRICYEECTDSVGKLWWIGDEDGKLRLLISASILSRTTFDIETGLRSVIEKSIAVILKFLKFDIYKLGFLLIGENCRKLFHKGITRARIVIF